MNETEAKILRKISEKQLVTRNELADFLRSNGGETGLDASLKRLMENDLIATIRPVGSTCFIITQRGARLISEID